MKTLFLIFILGILAACGGGNGGDDNGYTEETPPIVEIHPLAEALEGFFVNLAQPSPWGMLQEATHAVLVDIDGNGTQGVLATKWTYDIALRHPTATMPVLVQKLFYIYDDTVKYREALWNWGISSTGRVVLVEGADGQGISTWGYTLFDLVDGELTFAKTLGGTRYWRQADYGVTPGDDSFFVRHESNVGFWERDRELDIALTEDEYNELLEYHGLNIITFLFSYEIPDDTAQILPNWTPGPILPLEDFILAAALRDFFAKEMTVQPPYWGEMQARTHATIVDIDGNGIRGIIASKWTTDGMYNFYSTHPDAPFLMQQLFYVYDGWVRKMHLWASGITSSGRLVMFSENSNPDASTTQAYTFVELDSDGWLAPVEWSLVRREYWHFPATGGRYLTQPNSYFLVSHPGGEFFTDSIINNENRISTAEFDEMMARYGLHGTISHNHWELPDDSAEILNKISISR